MYAHVATCEIGLGINENQQQQFLVNQSESGIVVQSAMDLSNSNASIILTDIQGKQLLKESFLEKSVQIDLKEISNGVYFIRIVSEAQIIFTQKIQF